MNFSFAAEPAQSPPPSSTITSPLSMSRQATDVSTVRRSRRTDPTTSHAAAAKAERFAASHAGRIHAALRDMGVGTAKSIAFATGLSVVQVDRRLPELQRAGRVSLVLVYGEPLQRDGYRVWMACQ